MTPITALGSRYGIQGALGRSVKRAASGITDPTDISDCVVWVDFSDTDNMFTDAGTTKVSTNGDLIYQVTNKGSGTDFVQATESQRPKYYSNSQNGLSTAYFNSGGFVGGGSYNSANVTLIFVVKSSAINNDSKILFGLHKLQSVGYSLTSLKSGQIDAGTPIISLTRSSDIPIIVTTWFATDTGLLRVNGTSTTGSNYYSFTSTIHIGAYNGRYNISFARFCEGIVYNRHLSETEYLSVETYLNNKWAIYS